MMTSSSPSSEERPRRSPSAMSLDPSRCYHRTAESEESTVTEEPQYTALLAQGYVHSHAIESTERRNLKGLPAPSRSLPLTPIHLAPRSPPLILPSRGLRSLGHCPWDLRYVAPNAVLLASPNSAPLAESSRVPEDPGRKMSPCSGLCFRLVFRAFDDFGGHGPQFM